MTWNSSSTFHSFVTFRSAQVVYIKSKIETSQAKRSGQKRTGTSHCVLWANEEWDIGFYGKTKRCQEPLLDFWHYFRTFLSVSGYFSTTIDFLAQWRPVAYRSIQSRRWNGKGKKMAGTVSEILASCSDFVSEFWLLSVNQGLPSAEMQRRTGAELWSFAPHRLPDFALNFKSSNECSRLDRKKDKKDMHSALHLFCSLVNSAGWIECSLMEICDD
jgi:hypothetical protein